MSLSRQEHLLNLINNVLDGEDRIRSGGLKESEVDLNRLLHDAVAHGSQRTRACFAELIQTSVCW